MPELLDVLERIAVALERIADRDTKPAMPKPKTPSRSDLARAVELGRRKVRRKGLDA